MQSYDAKTRYALLAALDLAAHHPAGRPLKVRDIAARTGAPANYLVHVLLALKRRALVKSTRGPSGGYLLLRPPSLISAAEVVAAVSPRRRRGAPVVASGYAAAVESLFAEADDHARQFLSRATLADLLARLPAR
jgi:Rrf2 family protein